MAGLRRLLSRIRRQLFPPPPPPGEIPKAWLRRFLPDDPVIVECGAHEGYDTAEFSRLWPRGRILAFEALPSVFAILQERHAKLPNVRLVPMALGDREGTATFHVSSGTPGRPPADVNQSSSLLPPEETLRLHPHILFEQTIEVPVTTLDIWCEREAIGRVDLLWLDMQGFEARFLAACPRTLAGVRAVYTEVHRVPNYHGVMLYPDLVAWLRERGFVLVREELPWADGGNVLFVRREFVPPGFPVPAGPPAG